jgi:hypothetical protein
MQNRYVGDVGDFAKYGLLRRLVADGEFELAVVWCLFDDESHNADGRHTSYLKRPEFRSLDPELHDRLARIVKQGRRSVRQVSKARIFPPKTTFFDMLIAPPNDVRTDRTARETHRAMWLSRALAATVSCDLVFFDPDNGLETPSVPRRARKAGKYVFLDELKPFWNRGQSLVVYHHLNRTASVRVQTDILRERFSANFPKAAILKSLLFRRGSCRHFWIVGQKRHVPGLAAGIEAMLESGWAGYFEIG